MAFNTLWLPFIILFYMCDDCGWLVKIKKGIVISYTNLKKQK